MPMTNHGWEFVSTRVHAQQYKRSDRAKQQRSCQLMAKICKFLDMSYVIETLFSLTYTLLVFVKRRVKKGLRVSSSVHVHNTSFPLLFLCECRY